MANGKSTAEKKQKENPDGTKSDVLGIDDDTFMPKFRKVGEVCLTICTIPFAIFVGILEGITVGFMAGLKKMISFMEE